MVNDHIMFHLKINELGAALNILEAYKRLSTPCKNASRRGKKSSILSFFHLFHSSLYYVYGTLKRII